MKYKNTFTFFFLLFNLHVIFAQLPETDIYLSSLSVKNGIVSFSRLKNITSRKGYDNQPSFSPDGKEVFFVSVKDSTQSDLYSYSLRDKKISQITHTSESEYSPSLEAQNKYITVVRVDQDSGQRLYTIPLNQKSPAKLIPNTDSVGYYCRLNDSLIAMFILGPSNTLQILNTNSYERKLVASDIGRCFKLSSDKKNLFFVLKANTDEWFIYKMNIDNLTLTRITQTLKGSEDFALLKDGKIIMGKSGKLYCLKDNNWNEIADFSSQIKDFYRITLNDEGTLLALVVYTGKKP